MSPPAVPCEYLGAPCALRRVALCGACVPSHTPSAAIRTHARSAAACVARDCVVCCADTRAARAPTQTAVSAALYLLQPVDRRAVRLALPCELPLRRAEDLAEPEPHFVHHLRRGGSPNAIQCQCRRPEVSKRLRPIRPLEASGWLGSFRSSRRHGFTVGACGPYASPVTSATAVPRTPSARTSSAIETLKLRASTAMCVVSCSAAGWAGRIVANCEPHW